MPLVCTSILHWHLTHSRSTLVPHFSYSWLFLRSNSGTKTPSQPLHVSRKTFQLINFISITKQSVPFYNQIKNSYLFHCIPSTRFVLYYVRLYKFIEWKNIDPLYCVKAIKFVEWESSLNRKNYFKINMLIFSKSSNWPKNSALWCQLFTPKSWEL